MDSVAVAPASPPVPLLDQDAAALRQRQALILANLPGTVVALYDTNLHVVLTEGLTGHDPNELTDHSVVGLHVRTFFSPEDYQDVEPVLQAALHGQAGRLEHASPDGRWFSVNVAPFVEGGRITGVLTVWHDVTQARAAEQEMADAQALAHVGSWKLDLAAERLTWSDELCRIMGQPIGYSPTVSESMALVHPADRAALGEHFAAALDSSFGASDYRIHRPDGEIRYVHARRFGRHDVQGRLTQLWGTIQDVTERVEAERARLSADAQLKAAFDGAPIGMTMVSLTGELLRVNEAITRITGYSEAGIKELGPYAFVHPEDQENVSQRFSGLGTQSDHLTLTHRIVRADGAVAWVEARMTLMRDDQQQPLYVLGQILDVTEQRSAAAALTEARHRFEGAFAQAPMGMALVSFQGRFLQVNDALSALTGYSKDELTTKTFADITHPEDLDENLDGLHAVLKGALAVYRCEKRYIHADGHPVWVSMSTTMLRDGDGKPAHMLTHVLDVTDRRQMEVQLRHMADHDPLTGLANRRRFHAELSAHVARGRRYGPEGALVILDLDNFKGVNDTLGHTAGDRLLVEVATRMRGQLRETDVLARLGGDEFAVLLPKADREQAQIVAGKLLASVARSGETLAVSSRFVKSPRVTASVGVLVFESPEELSFDAAINDADLAMYEAKSAGRNRYRIFDRVRVGAPG